MRLSTQRVGGTASHDEADQSTPSSQRMSTASHNEAPLDTLEPVRAADCRPSDIKFHVVNTCFLRTQYAMEHKRSNIGALETLDYQTNYIK